MFVNCETADQRSSRLAHKMRRGGAEATALHGSVLVVDDSKDGRAIISRILSCVGLAVETAENGQEGCQRALAALEDGHPFDLILMDMSMPVMDGFEATTHLRAYGYTGRIAALTANVEARAACLFAGCDDFGAKPITYELLLDLAQRNL